MLQEIIKELKTPSANRGKISGSEVHRWMKRKDTDTLGATYAFLSNGEQVQRVGPPLSFDDVFEFLLRYYEFCLTTDPDSAWANDRYSAGWDLVGWFTSLWDEQRDGKYLQAIKSLLATLYVTGTPELKKCIEHAVMEHLFERNAIQEFFSEWRDNPQLHPAYEEGTMWVNRGGTSPLTKPRSTSE